MAFCNSRFAVTSLEDSWCRVKAGLAGRVMVLFMLRQPENIDLPEIIARRFDPKIG